MKIRKIFLYLICIFFFFFFLSSCTDERNSNRTMREPSKSGLESRTSNTSVVDNSTTFPSNINSTFENQMNIGELHERLKEVKEIERESRSMMNLRNNWAAGAEECHKIMTRLKPRARAIANEYKRMLSPAGIEIANAAMLLSICVNCIENEDDTDCRLVREAINKAEREIKKEIKNR